LRLDKSAVSSIDFTHKRQGDWWASIDDIDDAALKNLLFKKEETSYNEAGYITLLRNRSFLLGDDGHIERQTRVINKVLQERGKSVANQRFTYLSRIESAQLLFARGITSDGNIVSIKENATEDAPFFPNFLNYNNLRQKKFAIPESRIGSVLDYSYKTTEKQQSNKPFYASINFAGWEPTKTDSVMVDIPRGQTLKYKSRGLSLPIILKEKNRTKYIWIVKNIKGRKRENLAPPYKDIFPRLTFATSMTWKYVDSLLSSSLCDSLLYPPLLLSRLTKIEKLETNAKIDSLYNLVCKEIRYAPVPINATIPVPKSLKTIYKLKYANSLDKAYFLYGLLKKVGIASSIVFAREKKSGQLVMDVPSPTQFSYAVLLLKVYEDTLILDPREDTYTKRYINEEIQGEFGLILKSNGKFVKIPLLQNEKYDLKMQVRIKEDGSCDIKHVEYLNGGYGVDIRHLKEMNEKEKRKHIEQQVSSIYPGAELVDYSLSALDNLQEEVTLTMHYRIENFGTVAGNYLFLSLPEINYSAASVGAIKRSLPLFFNTSEQINHEIEFIFPKSFTVYHTPNNRYYEKPFVGFSSTFSKKGNRIVYIDHYNRNGTLIGLSNYENYRKCWQLMGELTEDLIVLKRK